MRDRDIVRLEPEATYRVGRAVVIDGLNLSLHAGSVVRDLPRASSGLHAEAVHDYRDRLLSALDRRASGRARGEGRVFVGRPQGLDRRRYNQQEVLEALGRFDLRYVEPQQLTFAGQVDLFRDAKVICGPSGAALANLIFTRAGTSIVTWTPAEHATGPDLWANLAAVAGSDVLAVPYRSSTADRLRTTTSAYRIDPHRIAAALDAAGA